METMGGTTRWEGCCPHCAGDVLEVHDRTPFLVCVDCGWPSVAPPVASAGVPRSHAGSTSRSLAEGLAAILGRLGVFALGRGQVQ